MAKKTNTSAVALEEAGDQEVTMDRRREERREEAVEETNEAPKTERRKVTRRRQIDPTTCERDYTNDEIEFMQAMDAYKRSSGRMFPTCSEILEVIRGLGYVRPGYGVHIETVSVETGEASDDFDTINEEDAISDSE
ncbi:MAG: hypothetical protein AAF497_12820 [Planctomycetota bacterium]